MPGKKQKLTLTVDPATIALAKERGVNISEVTEQVLRGYAIEEKGLDWAAYKGHYLAFLSTMDPLLEKYGASVTVGHLYARRDLSDKAWEGEVRYCGRGKFSTEATEELLTLDQLEGPDYSVGLSNPGHVLRDLVDELEKAKTRRREGIANLAVAARVVSALFEEDSSTNQKMSSRPKSHTRKRSTPGSPHDKARPSREVRIRGAP